ncbi:hypothetical protein O6H91_15G039400 [Diphasiastrum complanatum]|uniref:Uncharacterized protein n=1 Tax=Diphasiastrum complanatum TaxID=34168 RepID=A0ACC2BHJ2_DIPCM|nr:hypothetical protein O6H91_15G039400 [Diphasiastrum complanatum]
MQAGRKLLIAYAAGFLADIRSCMVKDIQIEQRETAPELGYPQFHVQISNNCMAGCTAHKIHVSCGDFHSYTGLNPATFRKLAYDNCLVLNGGPLETGKTVSFHYSSTFRYKLAAKLAVYFC